MSFKTTVLRDRGKIKILEQEEPMDSFQSKWRVLLHTPGVRTVETDNQKLNSNHQHLLFQTNKY